jgi:hypothetical protein
MRTLTALVLGGALILAGQAYAQSGASSGQSGDQPGSGSTAVPPGQGLNQPGKGGIEQRSMDMTGGQGALPSHYDVQAVRQGHLEDEKGAKLDQEVKNPQGETLGTIEKLLKSTKTGKIEYAVLEVADTKFQLPLQWSLFKQQGDKLTLKATKDDLRTPMNSHLAKDNSPEIGQYMDEINRARQSPKAGGGLGIQDETNRPASAGSMGEDKAGGGGPSGTPSMPQSGQAPQHEGGNPSSKR